MANILAVGIATLDIINSVQHYPNEDDEVRAVGQRLCRGGNATNTLVVLSQLGHVCHWAGVLVNEPDSTFIVADLQRYAIQCHAVTQLSHGKVPTSYITHNLSNGSRTIVHYRDLPEYEYKDFKKIELSTFDWLHFEGRNVIETAAMLEWAATHAPHTPRSVEIEKEREHIERLFLLADVLMFSKPFALGRGYLDATSFLQAMHQLAPQASLTCTWGEAGAYAVTTDGQLLHSPAYPPEQIVDTLGAGDTFNAGLISSLLKHNLSDALQSACQLAGKKCGLPGLNLNLNQETSQQPQQST